MLKAIHCNMREHVFSRATGIEQVQQFKDDPDSIFWLDMDNPTELELSAISDTFHLHPLAVEDATMEHQRPKVEDYEQFYFVVFYSVKLDSTSHELYISEVDMFLGKNYLITVHYKPLPDLEEAEHRWMRNVKRLEWGIGVLLYSLLDTIVDQYFPVVDALVDEAETLEDRMFAGTVRRSAITSDLLELKKRFLALRRVVTPERDVLNVLTNRDNPMFDEHVVVYFRDVYDHITRLADTLDLYRDQLSTVMDANLSIVSNELNAVMRTLTVASIILMVDSLIAGIYGMNFVNIPELHLQYGYYGALLLMLILAILLIFLFRRLRWL
ncbi:MAG TPA: magnesium/cobalt transporter CorA [Ktedonobacteraceae bacterium]|nr:magnesium/cobalt transporter CorA [Ktedonobacteraceae bacterium]